MQRIKISLPSTFAFTCIIPVRITDLNYGKHVGNDAVLSLIHEARMKFLDSLGYTEMKFDGQGMIMAAAVIEFRQELFYPCDIRAGVAVQAVSKFAFELVYALEIFDAANGQYHVAVAATTQMICYDYDKKKIAAIPANALTQLRSILVQ